MSRIIVALVVAALLVFAPLLRAAVVIGGTRVVFPAEARDVSIKLQNKGHEPALVQVWIDDGDERSTPSTAKAPFAITPPMFRIDPAQAHALRIVHIGDARPGARESLYWLNVLEIPPKAAASAGKNVLQLAFRHRIKVFHRPTDLATTPADAVAGLRWSVEREHDAVRLRVDNPSPYHVSFHAVTLPGDAAGEATALGGGMVAPGGIARFDVPRTHHDRVGGTVEIETINDYGAAVPASAVLTP